MSDIAAQASFNSGEWAPTLFARVDMQKYRSGTALLANFFVDYRGGASTRPGTKYILQAFKSSTAVRLIPFQAAFSIGYVLEFGDFYIRFYFDGAPVLEASTTISGATQANPGVIHDVAHGYSTGDWVLISGVVGMTQLNGNYYIVVKVDADHYSLTDLNGVAINTTTYGAYVSGGTAQRVYTLASPYAAADLALVKYAQNQSQMILCHPNYQPYNLTLITATNWTLQPITFGSSISAPTGLAVATTLAAGSVNYSYTVTAVDINGQESIPATPVALTSKTDLRTIAGTNNITWNAVSGAVSYNIYKSDISYFGVVAAGAQYGFIGNVTGVAFADSNTSPDFTQTPPIAENPFQGAGVTSVIVTAAGSYSTVPTATVAAAPTGGQTATVQPALGIVSSGLSASGSGFSIGSIVSPAGGYPQDVRLRIDNTSGGGITAYTIVSPGAETSGTVPASMAFNSQTPGGAQCIINTTWGVVAVNIISGGAGYTSVPAITFSAGAATATAVLAASTAGNPSVPGFFQQRLVLAALPNAPQSLYFSQSGNYFNYNISNPVVPSDAISATLVSGQLGTIKALVPQTSGLLAFTDKYSWIINGGSNGSAISPSAIVANAQSFNGISDVPPIVANFDVLYVQAKGSVVRDSAYNIYANVFTGTDISILASHLFYGYSILEWAFAEEPFKLVQCIRSDGTLLTLTFLKEQEFIGWTHSTTNGLFKSVTTVTEQISASESVDGTYFVTQRVINSNTVKYIERLADRTFPNGVQDAWCVDAGIQYSGSPTTSFSGAQHLAGATVTGLADGVAITPFVMPINGSFTLASPASKVTIGLGFTCQLQTLPLELGEPSIQGKVKKINSVDVRVADTLGLSIGPDFDHLVAMKDLVIGNVSSMLTGQETQTVTGLVNGDARAFLGAGYTVPGQYCIEQSLPYPATVLGVFPAITIGDSK